MVSKTFRQIAAAVALAGAFCAASAQSVTLLAIGGPSVYTFDEVVNGVSTLVATLTVNYDISRNATFLNFNFSDAKSGGPTETLTIDYTNNGGTALQQPYTVAAGIDTLNDLKLGGNGAHFTGATLTYTAIPAVPEPESYAMLLAGLGLIGTITIRRRNQYNG